MCRAVARPWRERRLPRAPDLREHKMVRFKLKNYQLNERKYFNTRYLYKTILAQHLFKLISLGIFQFFLKPMKIWSKLSLFEYWKKFLIKNFQKMNNFYKKNSEGAQIYLATALLMCIKIFICCSYPGKESNPQMWSHSEFP